VTPNANIRSEMQINRIGKEPPLGRKKAVNVVSATKAMNLKLCTTSCMKLELKM
jgi:hypothetical protein